MMLPSLGGVMLFGYSGGSPRGGMHTYAHAIIRCAIAHGARILTNSPVEEIIVRNGRAVGVQLAADASFPEKTIWARKAVISGADVKQTFLHLVGRQHMDAGFAQRIADVSLKGGSLFVMSVVCRELPKYHGREDALRRRGEELLAGGHRVLRLLRAGERRSPATLWRRGARRGLRRTASLRRRRRRRVGAPRGGREAAGAAQERREQSPRPTGYHWYEA
jgi:hypothetical protein